LPSPVKSLLDPETIRDPYSYYVELRREKPIAFFPEINGYFATSYALVRQILRDPRFQKSPLKGASDGRKFAVPHKAAQDILLRDAEIGLPLHSISESDGKRQIQIRRIVDPFLNTKASLAKESFIQSCVSGLLDELEKSDSCDVVAEFSSPFTIYVMCDLIGFPRSMHKEVKAYADAALTYLVYTVSEEEAVAGAKTMVAMHNIVREMIRERRSNPQDDLLTALATATVDGVPLTERQMCYMIEELVVGGNETTANAINGGLTHLAQYPELQDTLRRNPEQIPAFVEEALRLLSPIQSAHRVASEDIELEGVTIPAGAKVFLATASANRDEQKFACPAAFDHNRPDSSQHVSFGGGVHFCAGMHITRIEQRVAYHEWLKRFSSIELAQPAESIQFHTTFATRAPVSVQLRMKRA
jgi:cytochrome P450